MQLSLTAWLAMKWKDLSDKTQKEKQMGFLKNYSVMSKKQIKAKFLLRKLFHPLQLI